MTVNDLIYHLAALARDGKGERQVVLWDRHDGDHPAEHVGLERVNLVPEGRVQFEQDYIETVVIS